MSRFLCVGDLHLDKGGRYGRAPGERLAEQEAVWSRALELARDHDVDAVLFAGDAFEKRHPSTDALLAFERPLLWHRQLDGPPVIAIPGNHDRSGVSEWCALDVFAEAGLIYLYSRPTVWDPVGESSGVLDGPAVACLPWAPVSRIVAAHDGELDRDDVNQAAAELLVQTARELRESVTGPCVLLTHFSVSGAVTPDGADVGMFREPVLPVTELEAIGFEAIVAGHIHKPQPLTREIAPAFYVGSPMPLDFGEARCEHGVWVLHTSGRVGAEFLPIESRPFVTIDIDADQAADARTAPDAWVDADVAGAFVKVRLRGREESVRALDPAGIRTALLLEDDGAHNVWVETQVERETRARVDGVDETTDDTVIFDRWLQAESINGDQAQPLRRLHTDYLTEIR